MDRLINLLATGREGETAGPWTPFARGIADASVDLYKPDRTWDDVRRYRQALFSLVLHLTWRRRKLGILSFHESIGSAFDESVRDRLRHLVRSMEATVMTEGTLNSSCTIQRMAAMPSYQGGIERVCVAINQGVDIIQSTDFIRYDPLRMPEDRPPLGAVID